MAKAINPTYEICNDIKSKDDYQLHITKFDTVTSNVNDFFFAKTYCINIREKNDCKNVYLTKKKFCINKKYLNDITFIIYIEKIIWKDVISGIFGIRIMEI